MWVNFLKQILSLSLAHSVHIDIDIDRNIVIHGLFLWRAPTNATSNGPRPQTPSSLGLRILAGLAMPHLDRAEYLRLPFNPLHCKQTISHPLNKHFWAFHFYYSLDKGRLNSSVSVWIAVSDDGEETRRNSFTSQVNTFLEAAVLYKELEQNHTFKTMHEILKSVPWFMVWWPIAV